MNMYFVWSILGPILYVVLLFGALALVVYLLYRLIFKKYSRFLRAKYRYRLFNIPGAALMVIAAVYAFFSTTPDIIPFSEAITGFMNKLIFISSPEAALSAATAFASALPLNLEGKMLNDTVELVTYVLTIMMLLLPLIAFYAVNALIRTKNPLHALLSTFIMTAGALIAGSLGAVIAAFVVGFVIIYFLLHNFIAAAEDQAHQGHELYRRRDPE